MGGFAGLDAGGIGPHEGYGDRGLARGMPLPLTRIQIG